MPRFSKNSFTHLSTCHQDLQVIFYEVIKHFDCSILQGYRSEEEQNLAYKNERSKLRYPNSKHNKMPSMAVDVIAYPVDFSDTKLCTWFGGYVMGIAELLKAQGKITHSIRWGGSWNGKGKLNSANMLSDLVHFELSRH